MGDEGKRKERIDDDDRDSNRDMIGMMVVVVVGVESKT
jgi:hypothetical protein